MKLLDCCSLRRADLKHISAVVWWWYAIVHYGTCMATWYTAGGMYTMYLVSDIYYS